MIMNDIDDGQKQPNEIISVLVFFLISQLDFFCFHLILCLLLKRKLQNIDRPAYL